MSLVENVYGPRHTISTYLGQPQLSSCKQYITKLSENTIFVNRFHIISSNFCAYKIKFFFLITTRIVICKPLIIIYNNLRYFLFHFYLDIFFKDILFSTYAIELIIFRYTSFVLKKYLHNVTIFLGIIIFMKIFYQNDNKNS